MAYTNPSTSDFKAYFTRDFPYGLDDTTVQNADITKALSQAAFNFNESLYGSQSDYTMAFLYLTAHYLVIDLRASSQGIAGKFSWLESSKGVGSVSQSFSIPNSISEDPSYAMYCTTNYGAKFLSLLLPSLKGQIFTVLGGTKP